jgi:predicted outer membrane repeat protein
MKGTTFWIVSFFGLIGLSNWLHAQTTIRVGTGVGCATNNIQTAINAASNLTGPTSILLASNTNYAGQNLDIDGKNIKLVGGYSDCLDQTPSGQTQLNGSGGSQRSVINLRGATSIVEFVNLVISDGDELNDNSSYGGAIDVTGGPHAQIRLNTVSMSNNSAGLGGAFSVRGSTGIGTVNVFFDQAVTVFSNNASHAGGGIYCRDATLKARGTAIRILANTAGVAGELNRHGGGLYIDNCVVQIGATLAIGINTANGTGGGMYVIGSDASVDLYNVDPNFPLVVDRNEATRFGGGIAIESGATVRGYDIQIRGNIARQGGAGVAIYSDSGTRSKFILSRVLPSTSVLPDAVNCTAVESCNTIQDNVAQNTSNSFQNGAALRQSADGNSYADATFIGARIFGNRGSNLFYKLATANVNIPTLRLLIYGTLLDQNLLTGNLFFVTDDTGVNGPQAETQIYTSTIAGNQLGAVPIFGGYLECHDLLNGSIIWQPGKQLLASVDQGNQCARHVIANDFSNVPAGNMSTNLQIDPQFVDPANGNYRLRDQSRALDFSPMLIPATAADFTDYRYSRDGAPRNIDRPNIVNFLGANDLGAYEMPVISNAIFANGFE